MRDDVTSAFNFKVWSPTTLKVLTNAFSFKIRSQTNVKVLTDAMDLRHPTQHSKIPITKTTVGEPVCFAGGTLLVFLTDFHIVSRAPMECPLCNVHVGM